MASSPGTMTVAFVSAIDYLNQREIDKRVYDVSRDRSFVDVMRLVGRYDPITTGQPNYHNFINQDVFETGTISAVTSTGLAQTTFAVTTGSGYPRVGDVIKSSNANNVGKTARIQSVSLASGIATIVVRTPNNVPWFNTTNDVISVAGGNAYAEGSGSPTNRRYSVTKYFNLTQIFKEVDDITDMEKVARLEVDFNGQPYMLAYQTAQKLVYLQGVISAACIAGVQSVTQYGDASPFLVDADGKPIQTTGGLDWYITNYGISDSVASLGTLALTDLDEIVDNWVAAKAPLDQMAFHGIKPKRAFDKLVKNLGSSGVTSVRLVIDGKDANFEVDSLSYSGATMEFVYLPIIDQPKLFGPTITPDINGSFYFTPKDQIGTVGGGLAPRVRMRYTPTPFESTANTSSNGMIKEWRTGALASIPTSDLMQLKTNWATSQGFEAVGVQHMQKYRVV
jgi:hypothetical protein